MDQNETIKIMESKLNGRRTVGRPKNRWIHGELQDINYLKISDCLMKASHREIWRGYMRKDMAQFEVLNL